MRIDIAARIERSDEVGLALLGTGESSDAHHMSSPHPEGLGARLAMQAALRGEGVALAPPCMFTRELRAGRLVQPFAQTLDAGGYWLTRQLSREPTTAMRAFAEWLRAECSAMAID